MTRAVMEGVPYAIRDGLDVLTGAGTVIAEADMIGGGPRSRLWTEILAAALDRPLHRVAEGEHGAAFGAARLGRFAVTGEDPASLSRLPRLGTVEPDPALRDLYAESLATYRQLRIAVGPAP